MLTGILLLIIMSLIIGFSVGHEHGWDKARLEDRKILEETRDEWHRYEAVLDNEINKQRKVIIEQRKQIDMLRRQKV